MLKFELARGSYGFVFVALALGCGSSKPSADRRADGGTGGMAGSFQGGAGTGTSGGAPGGSAGKGGSGGGRNGSGGMVSAGAPGAAGGGNASGGAGEGDDLGGNGPGGMVGAAGHGANGGAPPNAEECPDEQPEAMSDCSTPGLSCRYPGECCPTRMTCITNANYWWEISECPPRCPATPPAEGSACDACTDLPSCTYDMCGDGSGEIVAATCDTSAGTWSTEGEPCEPETCGTETCGPGQVCAGFGCADNPCIDEPLSCTCAASLCEMNSGYTCGSTVPRRVNCTCSTC
jgi:hypothetical protein